MCLYIMGRFGYGDICDVYPYRAYIHSLPRLALRVALFWIDGYAGLHDLRRRMCGMQGATVVSLQETLLPASHASHMQIALGQTLTYKHTCRCVCVYICTHI